MSHSLLEFFLEIAGVPGPSGEEAGVLAKVESLASAAGATCRHDAHGNLYCSFFPEAAGTPLILCAHADTAFSTAGLNASLADGVIKTDGSTILGADNRAALACMAKALVSSSGSARPVTLLVTREEERGLVGAGNVDVSLLPAGAHCFVFDSASPIGTYVEAASTSITFQVRVKGAGKHIKDLDPADDVVRAGSGFLQGLLASQPGDSARRLMVSRVSANGGPNTSADEYAFSGNARSFGDEGVEEVRAFLAQGARQLEAQGFHCEVDIQLNCQGYRADPEGELVAKFRGVNDAIGVETKPLTTWGGSDVNALRSLGVDAINCGYGARNIHTVAEEIDLLDLERMFNSINILISQ